jgi:hypothetical protein
MQRAIKPDGWLLTQWAAMDELSAFVQDDKKEICPMTYVSLGR